MGGNGLGGRSVIGGYNPRKRMGESVTNGRDWEVLEGGVNLDKARESVMHALIELDAAQDGESDISMDSLMADLVETAENLGLHDYLRHFGLG